MSEVEELKNRIAVLEAALLVKQSDPYEVIVVRKPDPLPPRTFTGFWNIYQSRAKCHAHVHRSLDAALKASWPRQNVLDTICVEWEEGQTEGRWYSVKED